MPELTHLDEKLAEVLGLAQAAQQATKKVTTLARKEKESRLVAVLERMTKEAAQTEQRCQKVADTREGMKTQITKKARETKAEVVDFMRTYLEGGEALDGLEFLSMSEAGELAHLEILATLNETAGDKAVGKMVDQVLPVQRRHVDGVRSSALALAAAQDPSEEA